MAEVVYKIEEESSKRSKLKTVLIASLLAFVLVGGGTLAYLSTETNKESNIFTAGNIDAELIEPAWKPAATPDGTSGSEIAEKMLPGVTAPKDPAIVNTSYSEVDGTDGAKIEENEWVALRLTFQKSDGNNGWVDMTAADITALNVGLMTAKDGNAAAAGFAVSTTWGSNVLLAANVTDTIKPNEFVYVYQSELPYDNASDANVTTPIFDSIGINTLAGSDEWTSGTVSMDQYMSWLNSAAGANGQFNIKVEGAAIQKTGFANAAAATKPLLTTLGYTVTA